MVFPWSTPVTAASAIRVSLAKFFFLSEGSRGFGPRELTTEVIHLIIYGVEASFCRLAKEVIEAETERMSRTQARHPPLSHLVQYPEQLEPPSQLSWTFHLRVGR